ncbi:MAG: hypothetical protein ACREBP_05790, partial [Sphingomicrobium sp.]
MRLTMPGRASFLVLSVIGAAALAAGVVFLVAGGNFKSGCAYGSGRTANSCKARPAATLQEISAAMDGSAMERALAALARSPDAKRPLLGVGLNRWGEVSFAFAHEGGQDRDTNARFVRFGPQGTPVNREGAQSGYLDVAGSTPFDASLVNGEALRKVLARVDRPERFVGARFEPALMIHGLAWQLSYVSLDAGLDAQPASYYMAADGRGLCRMNPGPPPSPVPNCDFWNPPTTAGGPPTKLPGGMAPPARPPTSLPSPASDPAHAK